MRPLRSCAHHAVVPRGRRVLDRRVRDLLRADGRVAIARHRAAARPARAHARGSSPGSRRRRSPSSTGSTTTCATSPTTTTRTRARTAGSSGTAIAAPSRISSRSSRSPTSCWSRSGSARRARSGLRVHPAHHAHGLVEVRSGTGTPRRRSGTVTVNFADLPGADALVDRQLVRRERVGVARLRSPS